MTYIIALCCGLPCIPVSNDKHIFMFYAVQYGNVTETYL